MLPIINSVICLEYHPAIWVRKPALVNSICPMNATRSVLAMIRKAILLILDFYFFASPHRSQFWLGLADSEVQKSKEVIREFLQPKITEDYGGV